MLYKYCSYWGTWNRVLAYQESPRYLVREFSLTPINPTHDNAWEELKQGIVIREHCTAFSTNDRLYTRLPAEIKVTLIEHLGRSRVDRYLKWSEEQLPIRKEP